MKTCFLLSGSTFHSLTPPPPTQRFFFQCKGLCVNIRQVYSTVSMRNGKNLKNYLEHLIVRLVAFNLFIASPSFGEFKPNTDGIMY